MLMVLGVSTVLLLVTSGKDWYLTHVTTRYSPGFSHANWKRITNGMPVETVTNLIGNSFSRKTDARWFYSFHRDGSASVGLFRQYWLVISNGVVLERKTFTNND